MSISKAEHDELCCVYAGLLLFDDGAEITSDKIQKIIKASGNEVDSYYPEFFANYLKTADIGSLLNAQPAAGGAAPAEEKKEDAKEDKKDDKKGKDKGKDKKKEEEKKKQEEEEDDDDFGIGGLF